MKRTALIILLLLAIAPGLWAFPPSPPATPFAGTESTTGSAGSLKSPATTGKTTITGPAAGATRNLTIPDADLTIGTLTNTKWCVATATGFSCTNDAPQPADADLTTYAGITPSANVQTLLGSADFAAFRTNLSLVVGTNVQAAFTGTPERGDVLYYNGSAWVMLNHGTSGQILQSGGHGADPSWTGSFTASIKANDVDAHEDISLSAAQVSRTFIHNLSQGAATVTATLPAAAEGYTFIAFVSSKVAQDWVFDGNGAETIYTDIGGTLTAGRAGIKCNNQEVGSRMSCATFKTGAASWAWLCGAISGTWTAIAP